MPSPVAGAMADTAVELEFHAAKIQKLFAQLQTERAARPQNTTEYQGIRHRLLKKMKKAESILRNRHSADISLNKAIARIAEIDPKFAGDPW